MFYFYLFWEQVFCIKSIRRTLYIKEENRNQRQSYDGGVDFFLGKVLEGVIEVDKELDFEESNLYMIEWVYLRLCMQKKV